MKKKLLFIAFMLVLVACSNTAIPLPPEAKESITACPEEILHLGGTCYWGHIDVLQANRRERHRHLDYRGGIMKKIVPFRQQRLQAILNKG